MYNLKKIVLTGATSTIGTALIRQCIENSIEVIAFVNPGSSNEKRIPNNSLIKKIYCSLDEMKTFEETSDLSAQAFFHLAWGFTNRQVRDNPDSQADNIKYSLDSVELARKLGCSVYIGAGSQAEYGRYSEIISEETITKPETAYGMAKLCSGQMTRLKCDDYGIKHIWPRIFSTYGPNTQDSTIINYTINSLLHQKKPSLSKCEQIWDFLYVDDAAKALLLLAEKGKNGEIYNIASGKTRTLKEYIEIVKRKIDSSATIGYGELSYNSNTVMHLAADITKVRRDIGFEPSIDFEEGIEKTIAWAKMYYM